MAENDQEDGLLRSVALQNANSIHLARQRAEQELIRAKEALELKTQELDHSISMMRATLESTTDGILVTSEVGKIRGFNRNFLEIWRLPDDVMKSVEHMQLLDTLEPNFQNPAAYRARIVEIYATAPPESHDLLELRDGRLIERYSRVQVIERRSVGRVWSLRDITARRHADEVRFRLAAVVESSDDAILSMTLDAIVTTWNKGAQLMFGYKADEIIGKSVTILAPPDRVDEESGIMARLKRGERVEHYETVRVRKDGTRLDVSLSVSAVKDATGRIIGVSKISRDITERKRAEQALREEARILELLNKTGTAIASQLELQSLLQMVTDSATQLSGAKLGAFFSKVIRQDGEFLIPNTLSGAPRQAFENFSLPRNTPLFNATFQGGVVRSPDITRDPRYGVLAPHHGLPGGHPLVRSYLAVPVISRSGEVIGALFFGHPDQNVFTERIERIISGVAGQAAVAIDNARLFEETKSAAREREQFLEAERAARAEAERISVMKDEFLATLSHELRTPLSAILGWSRILQSGAVNSEDLKQGLAAIARNAAAQTQLIEDLLDMSRIISGKVRLDAQRTDLVAVVEAAIDVVRPTAEAKGVRIRKILDPQAGPVSGDPTRLQQVVWNLLSNAVKFTPKGGKVEVLLERVNSHLEITVSDSGQGIAPQFLPHVFERFRQADFSITRKHSGLGLGLAIAKHIVELHGGAVRASSAGEGQGATFVVVLPLAPVRGNGNREHPEAEKPPGQNYGQIHLGGAKVLVVDDEPDAREIITRVLVQCRAEVITAASAAEAIELIKTQRPDVMVSDIGMPERDGYQLIRDVRKLAAAEGGKTPAIALTAFARSEDRTRAMMAGYQVHVSKPIEPYELLATVANLTGRMPLESEGRGCL